MFLFFLKKSTANFKKCLVLCTDCQEQKPHTKNDTKMPVKLLLLFSLSPLFLFAQNKKKFKLPDALNEVSGVIYHSPENILYANDGGHPAEIYQTDAEGNILTVNDLPFIRNKDWEDLTRDENGNIYIGDFGNNANSRRDLKIYILDADFKLLDSIPFSFPDQTDFPPTYAEKNFDTEAFFWQNNRLHLFSKSALGNGNFTTRRYTLSDKPGTQTARLHSDYFFKKRVITSAAVSADGKKVALLSYHFKFFLGFFPVSKTSVFVLSDFPADDYFKGKIEKYKIKNCLFPSQYESVDFVNENKLIVVSERTAFIRARGRFLKIR